MLIESKIKIGPDSMFNIHQASFKSAHLLNKIARVQFQRNMTENRSLTFDRNTLQFPTH